MADKFRFFNIGKANTEIERLESLVADRDAALAAAQEKITSLEAQPKPEGDQTAKDLATAKQTIGTLEAQVKAKDGEITALKASVAAKDQEISTFKSQLDTKAAEKAAQITASQGQPPVAAAVPPEKPSATAPVGSWTERCLAAKTVTQKTQ